MVKRLMSKKTVLILFIFFAVASAGISIGRWTVASVNAEGEIYEELKLFSEAISLVRKNYVEEVKPKDLIYGSIKGMLGSLEVVLVADWRLTVVDVERNRISKVKIEKVGPGSFAPARVPSRE